MGISRAAVVVCKRLGARASRAYGRRWAVVVVLVAELVLVVVAVVVVAAVVAVVIAVVVAVVVTVVGVATNTYVLR